MLRVHTYVVRIYRPEGVRRVALAGVVEVVEQQRSLAFRGLTALGAILSRPLPRSRKWAERWPVDDENE